MKPGILVTVYNRKQHVAESLASLAATVPGDVPVVALDDGSTDGAREVVSARFGGRFQVENTPSNIGLCRASNYGFGILKLQEVDVFVRVNSDVVFFPGWLETLVRALDRPSAGVAGPLYESFGTSGVWPNQDAGGMAGTGVRSVPCVVGHCIAIAKGVLDDGFRFDAQMYPVGPCDVDLCCFAAAYGYRCVVASAARCSILPSAKSTVGHPGFEYNRCFPEYQKVLRQRWGPHIYDHVVEYQYKAYPGEPR